MYNRTICKQNFGVRFSALLQNLSCSFIFLPMLDFSVFVCDRTTIFVFLFLRILSLLDVLLLDVANEPQLTNNHTWDNTISNTADQNGSYIIDALNVTLPAAPLNITTSRAVTNGK